jgi:hypothetical protein
MRMRRSALALARRVAAARAQTPSPNPFESKRLISQGAYPRNILALTWVTTRGSPSDASCSSNTRHHTGVKRQRVLKSQV